MIRGLRPGRYGLAVVMVSTLALVAAFAQDAAPASGDTSAGICVEVGPDQPPYCPAADTLRLADETVAWLKEDVAHLPLAAPDPDYTVSMFRSGNSGAWDKKWYCHDVPRDTWCIFQVRHRYGHHAASNAERYPRPSYVVCQKLIRDSDGGNYGTFACGDDHAAQSYSGTVLTKPLMKNSKSNDYANQKPAIDIYGYAEY